MTGMVWLDVALGWPDNPLLRSRRAPDRAWHPDDSAGVEIVKRRRLLTTHTDRRVRARPPRSAALPRHPRRSQRAATSGGHRPCTHPTARRQTRCRDADADAAIRPRRHRRPRRRQDARSSHAGASLTRTTRTARDVWAAPRLGKNSTTSPRVSGAPDPSTSSSPATKSTPAESIQKRVLEVWTIVTMPRRQPCRDGTPTSRRASVGARSRCRRV
jgi:hypothetical protein